MVTPDLPNTGVFYNKYFDVFSTSISYQGQCFLTDLLTCLISFTHHSNS